MMRLITLILWNLASLIFAVPQNLNNENDLNLNYDGPVSIVGRLILLRTYPFIKSKPYFRRYFVPKDDDLFDSLKEDYDNFNQTRAYHFKVRLWEEDGKNWANLLTPHFKEPIPNKAKDPKKKSNIHSWEFIGLTNIYRFDHWECVDSECKEKKQVCDANVLSLDLILGRRWTVYVGCDDKYIESFLKNYNSLVPYKIFFWWWVRQDGKVEASLKNMPVQVPESPNYPPSKYPPQQFNGNLNQLNFMGFWKNGDISLIVLNNEKYWLIPNKFSKRLKINQLIYLSMWTC